MADKRGLEEAMLGKVKEDAEPEVELGPCASRPTTKWWPGFHLKNANVLGENRRTTRSVDYSHMGYREFDPSGTFFLVEFNEPEKWRIRVDGRALWVIYNYLHQHRLEWIEAAVGNAGKAVPDGVPFIEQISIQRIEDKPQKG